MTDDQDRFEEKLPARITGLVFWGLVFVGLLVAVIILRNTEAKLERANQVNTRVLAYEIEEVIEQHPRAPVVETASSRIRLRVNELKPLLNFHSVRLQEAGSSLLIGVPEDDDDHFTYTLHYYPEGRQQLQAVTLDVHTRSAARAIADLRKKMLLSIGLGVFVFGLFLQRVLHRMLSSPFQKMVQAARAFSQGDETARFDDSRQDEFGYLGGFINNALHALLQKNEELMAALGRVSRSEQELSMQKEHAEVTLHAITDSVITVDIEGNILYVNPAAENLLLLPAEEISGKPFAEVFHLINENTHEALGQPLFDCFATGKIVKLPEHSALIIDDGAVISIEASIAPMRSDNDELIGAVMVIQDVSHTRRLTRQLSYHASHDLLTGLYNRRKFEEHLKTVLQNLQHEDRCHALFYLDLDNFKIVNDTCGHVAGDELLKQLPELFNTVLRAGDLIARLGGDEFGIILENCQLHQAVNIANKIRQRIKEYRFVWNDKTFEIGVSIGVVSIDRDNADMAGILSSADIACYAAKDSGRNRVHVFEPTDEMVTERFGQMHWTARIAQALEQHRFRLYIQPIIGMGPDTSGHAEILLRMIDESGDVIPPGAFIPAAERYGLMPEIDRWVIREVFRYLGAMPAAQTMKSERDVWTINLSGDSINDDKLLDYILEQKEHFGIDFHSICFEVTETVAISNLSKATRFIHELKQYGCQFALDDFGSGLSSFAYLKTLPVDYLKIDGSFVRDIRHDEIDRAMVVAIVQVAQAMNLKTIAEHVESAATLAVLNEIGIDYVQGYHLGRPQPLVSIDRAPARLAI